MKIIFKTCKKCGRKGALHRPKKDICTYCDDEMKRTIKQEQTDIKNNRKNKNAEQLHMSKYFYIGEDELGMPGVRLQQRVLLKNINGDKLDFNSVFNVYDAPQKIFYMDAK